MTALATLWAPLLQEVSLYEKGKKFFFLKCER